MFRVPATFPDLQEAENQSQSLKIFQISMRFSAVIGLTLGTLAFALPADPSHQLQTIDQSAIKWTKATSKLGKPFEIGVLESPPNTNNTTLHKRKEKFGMQVNWPVGDDTWVPLNVFIQSIAGLTQYKLHSNGGVYSYILWFTNTEHYDYFFVDQTEDSYEVNTYRNGDHYVRYNSEDPTIQAIWGF